MIKLILYHGPVGQRVDNAIQQINHDIVDKMLSNYKDSELSGG